MDQTYRYLSTNLAAPDRLDGIYEHLALEIASRRRSPFSHVQQRRLLLGGSTVPVGLVRSAGEPWHDFPVAHDVSRTPDAIALYVERLIAPDHLVCAREVIRGHLGICEPDQTAAALAELDAMAPSITTALLELRIGRAHRLFKETLGYRIGADDSPKPIEYDFLLSEMTRVRIAYHLRLIAMDCARQIHAPYGWDALDDLEKPTATGTLRVGTLVKRLREDIKLAEKAFALYTRNRRSEVNAGTLAYTPLLDTGRARLRFAGLNLQSTGKEIADLAALDLNARARVQLALWRAQHGDALEPLLAHTVQRMQRDLEMLSRGLDARLREAGWNAVAGNVGRTPAAVRLYLAAEEAVAWTAPAVSHASETSADLEAIIEGPMRKDPIDIAVTWLSSFRGRKRDLPMPRLQHEHAFTVDQLFTALRFAFLQDNDVLPLILRQVTDPKTGKKERVKTHDKAARITGRRYSFPELWNAFEDKRDRKIKGLLPTGARREFSEALQTDIEAKRQASELRKRPAQDLSGDARKAMSALGAAVRRGFLAP